MNPKKRLNEYNTSDVGYMDEEWKNYVPDWMKKSEENSEEKKENQVKDEEQVEEVQ